MSVVGRVHSIETCGAVDGPGIRYVVFMQGCLMRCKYCHNRDSWDQKAGTEMSVDTLMKELVQYKAFMDASGGGVTISGGESMLQPEFVYALFKACKEEGINTCLDTSAFIHKIDETVNNVLEVTDLVLLDIKQIDEKKHIDLTSVSNKYALRFAKHLAEINKDVYLRYVVIPGYTDGEKDAEDLGKFIEPLKNIVKVELLPYHELGKSKWTEMGEIYPLDGVKPPTRETMDKIQSILLKYHPDVIF